MFSRRDKHSPMDTRLATGVKGALVQTFILSVCLLVATYLSSSWITSAFEKHGGMISSIERVRFEALKLGVAAAQTVSMTPQQRRTDGREAVDATRRALEIEVTRYEALHPLPIAGEDVDRDPTRRMDIRVRRLLSMIDVLDQALAEGGGQVIAREISGVEQLALKAAFDAIVARHRATMKTEVGWLKVASIGIIGVTFLLFLLQWLLTYRPLEREIIRRNRDLMRANARINHAMLIDDVTGLPNRKSLLDALNTRLKPGDPVGIIHIDLLRFREINDIFGWDLGDKVLYHVAQTLESFRQPDENAARVGSNSFLFVTSRRAEPAELEDLADMISFSLTQPVVIEGQELAPNPVIGITARSEETRDASAQSLIADSQIALANAKSEGGHIHFTNDMRERLATRRRTAFDLARALERDEITPYFQPQIDTGSGKLIGFEALVRWAHPERGLLTPAEFLDVCESANLSMKLSKVMVRKSLAGLQHLRENGVEAGSVGINFTARELRDPEFADRLLFDIDRAQLSPGDVAVELLETALIEQTDDPIKDTIARLSSAGCKIDLDDFGTGHASLSNLLLFQVDRLKIDRSFISNLHRKPDQRKMTEALVRLAETLGIETLGEGVEDREDWQLLSDLGCQSLQGFGIGHPMPLHEISAWLECHNERVAKGAIVAA